MSGWVLWRRQMAGILRLEMKKSFFARRGLWIYLLALGPLFLTIGHSLYTSARGTARCSIAEDSMVFAGMFQFFYLKFAIFFGCVAVFTNLFRGEVLERTLHYYLLAPVRREVLLAGKYVSGLTATAVLFAISVVLAFLTMSAHFGQEYWNYILRGPGRATGMVRSHRRAGMRRLRRDLSLHGPDVPQSYDSGGGGDGMGRHQRIPAAAAEKIQRNLLPQVAVSCRRAAAGAAVDPGARSRPGAGLAGDPGPDRSLRAGVVSGQPAGAEVSDQL